MLSGRVWFKTQPLLKSSRRLLLRASASTMSKRRGHTDKAHFNCHIKVLRTDLPHSSPSLLLLLEHERYVFNCGESMQRLLHEYKHRVSQSDHYIFTQTATNTLAGLPGVIMGTPVVATENLHGQKPISITGPVGIGKYIEAFKTYGAQHPVALTEQGRGAAPGAVLPPTVSNSSLSISSIVLVASPSTPPSATAISHQPSTGSPPPTDAAAPAAEAAGPGAAQMSQDSAAAAAAAAAAAGGPNSGSQLSGEGDQSSERSAKRPRLSAAAGQRDQALQALPPVLCYVCEVADRPGKFDPKKAASLGVPRGPLLGQLQRGRSVEVPTGRVVHPHEVMDPVSVPGPVVAVVDCPREEYIKSLASSSAWDRWTRAEPSGAGSNGQAAAEGSSGDASGDPSGISGQQGGPGCGASPGKQLIVVHLTPWRVVGTPQYQEWMRKLPGSCVHLVADHPEARRGTMLGKAAVFQAKLNLLDPIFFALGPFLTTPRPAAPPAEPTALAQDPPLNVFLAGNMLKYNIYPPRLAGIDGSEMPGALDLAAQIVEFRSGKGKLVADIEECLRAGQVAADTAATRSAAADAPLSAKPEVLNDISRDELEITFLGTASAIPAAYRNVSGIWVDMFDRGAMMIDCGEDSFGQLMRRFGQEEAEEKVKKLKIVWVSHMHADHHGGLYPLMTLRQRLLGPDAPPLLIIGPYPLGKTLSLYRKVIPIKYELVYNDSLSSSSRSSPDRNEEVLALFSSIKQCLKLKAVTTFPVQHIRHSFGLSLEGEAGWKVVFSGDTRPCQQVVDAAKGATLLVHEATFEDELREEAVAKQHSTFSEAIQVAKEAGVYRLILTHFSQRYPQLPTMADTVLAGNEALAFDLMTVNLADVERLPRMMKPLALLLAEESASMEADAQEEDGAGAATAAVPAAL